MMATLFISTLPIRGPADDAKSQSIHLLGRGGHQNHLLLLLASEDGKQTRWPTQAHPGTKLSNKGLFGNGPFANNGWPAAFYNTGQVAG